MIRPTLRQRGFTLVELLLVVAMVMILTLLAYPTLKSFSGQNADIDVASDLANLVNKARDQARRHNRAMVLEFRDFNGALPGGRLRIREANTGSCQTTVQNLNAESRILETVPFGQSVENNYNGHQVLTVGLAAWRDGDGRFDDDNVSVCVTPDGAIHSVDRDSVSPLSGRQGVRVQRFIETSDGWQREGPPRTVELTFAGGARVGLH